MAGRWRSLEVGGALLFRVRQLGPGKLEFDGFDLECELLAVEVAGVLPYRTLVAAVLADEAKRHGLEELLLEVGTKIREPRGVAISPGFSMLAAAIAADGPNGNTYRRPGLHPLIVRYLFEHAGERDLSEMAAVDGLTPAMAEQIFCHEGWQAKAALIQNRSLPRELRRSFLWRSGAPAVRGPRDQP